MATSRKAVLDPCLAAAMRSNEGGGTRFPCVLALGGERKSSICRVEDGRVGITAVLGNVDEPGGARRFRAAVDEILRRHALPDVVAHDLHPAWQSTLIARRLGRPTIAVQHHHAHIASVLAEHGELGPVIGIACDGFGYGADGTAWGCELLRCERGACVRLGGLERFPLIGGDAAARENWRPAAALLRAAFGSAWHEVWPAGRAAPEARLIEQMIAKRVNAPLTSSLGRVFDAVAFLLGLSSENGREAEAPAILESAAAPGSARPYPSELVEQRGQLVLRVTPMVQEIVAAIRAGAPAGEISARFHDTVVDLLARAAFRAGERMGIATFALSGGCFVNQRLRTRLLERLRNGGARVWTNERVSPGDAGLSLGQAFVAMWTGLESGDAAAPVGRNRRMTYVSCGAGTSD